LRPPDVLFDQEATIDLGGVTARLLCRIRQKRLCGTSIGRGRSRLKVSL
jgi:hypothetical protein